MLGIGSILYFIMYLVKKIEFLTKYMMSEHEPSAPADDIQVFSFKQNLYPKASRF
jgi:hypothetical protein